MARGARFPWAAATTGVALLLSGFAGLTSAVVSAFRAPAAAPAAPTLALETPGVSGLTVTMRGTATAPSGQSIAATVIDWGDGVSSTGSLPRSHTYAAAGTYTVTVTVTASDGRTATASAAVTVAAAAEQPRATLTILSLPEVTPPAGAVAKVAVANTGSVAIDTTLTGEYYFGTESDPSTWSAQGAWNSASVQVAAGQTVEVTITGTGVSTANYGRTFVVQFRLEGVSGATATGTLQVAGAPAQPPSVSLGSPQVSGRTVTLDGSVTAGSAALATVETSWGDGTHSSGDLPQTHTYPDVAGTRAYTIVVTATDTDGLAAHASADVSISVATSTGPALTMPARAGAAFGDANTTVGNNNSRMEATGLPLSAAGYLLIAVDFTWTLGRNDTILQLVEPVCGLTTSGSNRLGVSFGAGNGMGVAFGFPAPTDVAWHRLLVQLPTGAVPSASNSRMWLDGSEQTLETGSAGAHQLSFPSSGTSLIVSGFGTGAGDYNDWDGDIANLALWSRPTPFGSAEVAEVFGGALPEDGLIAYYPFDDGSGSVAKDVVGGHDLQAILLGAGWILPRWLAVGGQ